MAEYTTISFDENADIFLDEYGNIAMSDNAQALSFITLNAIRTVRGELIFNSSLGVPYFTTIFASPANIQMWEFYVKETAGNVPGITAVDSFVYQINGNNLNYEMVLSTDTGEVTING